MLIDVRFAFEIENSASTNRSPSNIQENIIFSEL